MRAGLEVHQQLATGKLFCACPAELTESVFARIVRELRATGGENHGVDAAAAFQASRGLRYRYESGPSNCLVELDEEPPHALNAEAVDVALTVAELLHARPLDEIEVMRKIVVDGSNTSGFQRTALVAVGGWIKLGSDRCSIQTVCLEEDAARKVDESSGEVSFRLDRLGIPLIEIATGPEITSGPQARALAEEIGALLRSTGRVRRGIGTIREDLNVSTEGGTRVEIKGVQELRLIERYVELEERRQRTMLEVRDQLRARGARVDDRPPTDFTDLLREPMAAPMGNLLRRKGVALAIALPGFAGMLKPDGEASDRLGRELADRARVSGVKGLLHSDELPGYGIDAGVVDAIRQRLELEANDAFVIVVAPSVSGAERALGLVAERARLSIEGVPPETRDPLPDGRTRYSRPLPGRDRMYPETDVPPILVTPERLRRVREHLPEAPEIRRERIVRTTGLGREVVRQLDGAEAIEPFERLVRLGHGPAAVARLLTQDITEATAGATEGTEPAPELSEELLHNLLSEVERGTFAKEGIPPVLRELLRGAASIEEASRRAGVSGLSKQELEKMVAAVVEANRALVRDRKGEAFSALMGDLMREVRGRRDGREVAELLRREISRRSEEGPS